MPSRLEIDAEECVWPVGWKRHILIAGLGNVLLMDDGVGVHAIRALLLSPPGGTLPVEVGTALLDALALLEEADYVLAIDAMEAGGKPGTVYAYDNMEREGIAVSLHELGLRAALDLLPPGKRPVIRALGVEPERIDYGLDLTPTVASSLPLLLSTVRKIVLNWQTEDDRNLRENSEERVRESVSLSLQV